jgi:glucose/mannose transport system substrate-binding protein
MSFHDSRINRRKLVLGSAAVFAAAPLGAYGIAAAQDASPAAGGGTPEDQLEIFSWWTTAGEAAGLQQLFDAFSAQFPDVEVVNAAVAGGAGSNAQVALQTRLSAGEPPDSWQSHPGAELWARYVEPGYTEPVTALYEEQGWNDRFPQGVLDQITFDGEVHLVPVGVHRGNVMFYNRQVLADNGIDVSDDWTMDDYFAAAETLSAAGVAALGLGSKDTFAVVQLFENTLLATLGPDDFAAIWRGEVGWDDERVTHAIEYLAQYFDSVNEDHPALTWDGAADAVYAGTAAFTSMGDWLYGDATAKEQAENTGWVNHPGTGGSFVAVIDGFTMPVGAPHPVNARNWLIAAGSAEAQAAFAPHKGAIPARSDADASGFSEYMQWSAGSFGADAVVPSLPHGGAASPQFQQAVNDAIITFVVDLDVATFQEALVLAGEDAAAAM